MEPSAASYLKDVILAVVFFIYPFLLLPVSRLMSTMGFRKDAQRKFVHSGMGLVIFFVPFFDHLWIAIIPPILFAALNAVDYAFGWFSEMQGEDRGNVGTILYPISYVILMLVFFRTSYWGLAVLGILTMAFGDAGASIIGRAFGKTTYTINGETRSIAGTATMFIISFLIALIVCIAYGGQFGIHLRLLTLVSASFIIAGIATVVEALSIKGSDNITVPVLTALAAWALFALFMPNVLGNEAIVNQPLF